MIHFPLDKPAECDSCGVAMRPDEWFTGPNMWHEHWWVCKHTKTHTCPKCYDEKKYKPCPACGCEEEYC